MNSTKQNSKKNFNWRIQLFCARYPILANFSSKNIFHFRVGFTMKVCFLGDWDKPKNIDSLEMMDTVGADFHDLLHF